MVAGPPGPPGASAAAVVVLGLKCGSGPATTPHLDTAGGSVSARVEKRGELALCLSLYIVTLTSGIIKRHH